ILISAVVVTSTISLDGWQRIFKKFGTRQALLISFVLSSFCALPILFTSSLLTTVLVLAILGLSIGGALLLGPDLLYAELIDEDFVQTGVRPEGLYPGILGFM